MSEGRKEARGSKMAAAGRIIECSRISTVMMKTRITRSADNPNAPKLIMGVSINIIREMSET
jgi:hypothetical protein